MFLLFCSTLVQANADEELGKLVVLTTPHGEVHLRVVGDLDDKNNAVILCLPGANPSLKDEWLPIMTSLSEHGKYASVLVYTHMLRKRDFDVIDFLHHKLLSDTLQASRVFVMGKSAGGSLAQAFALKYPDSIRGLVLAAPASSVPEHIAVFCATGVAQSRNTPLLLAWAMDDPSFGKSQLWLDECRNDKLKKSSFSFYSAKTGGHRVLQEYSEPILNFLQKHRL